MAEDLERPLRVGLVGVGKWGRSVARTIREEVPGMVLHRAGSTNPEAPEIVGSQCKIHRNWRELLTVGDLDGILTAVPARLHREYASAIIDAGIPLFMEKPMTLNVPDAEALLERARSAGAIVHVDHVDLHNPGVDEMFKVMRERGPLQRIEGHIGSFYERRPDIEPLWEYSPHFIAVSIALAGGPPTHVSARNLPRETEPKDDSSKEIILLDMEFAGGVTSRLAVGNGMALKTRKLAAFFPDCAVHFDDRGKEKLNMRENGQAQARAVDIDLTLPLTFAIRRFGDAIRKRQADYEGVEMGLEVVRILDAAGRAQQTGNRVAIS